MTALYQDNAFSDLTLTGYQWVTAAGCCPATVYAHVMDQKVFAQPVPGYETQVWGIPAVPVAASAIEADWQYQSDRLSALLDRYLDQPEPLTEPASQTPYGLVVTSPEPVSDFQITELGFNPHVRVESDCVITALALWQAERQQNPDIREWYWLSLDSFCSLEWLETQERPYCPELNPDGTLPGEALVLTRWSVDGGDGPRVGFSGVRLETRDRTSRLHIGPPKDARTDLMRTAEPTLGDRPPQWAECLTNDGFDEYSASVLHGTEMAFWPKHRPDPVQVPGEPLVGWSRTLGDVGLASLPLGLVLAARRLEHPMMPLDAVGVLVQEGYTHHHWRLIQDNRTD